MRLSFSVLLFALLCSSSVANWLGVGPAGGTIRGLAVSPADENIIYVAPGTLPCQIHRSTDGGATWNIRGTIEADVAALAVHPFNADVVYASAGSVHESTDGGMNWTAHVVPNAFIYDVAVNPVNPNILYAAGKTVRGQDWVMSFSKSTNAGIDWTTVGLDTMNGDANRVTIDPSDPNVVYVGGSRWQIETINIYPKVYKSTNGGTNFTDLSSGLPMNGQRINDIAIHPAAANIVYLAAFNGIYRSTAGGGSWTLVSSYPLIYSLATSPAANNIAYAGADTCVYKSTNGGISWSYSGPGFYSKAIRGLEASPADGAIVWAANNVGIFKTVDGGATWAASNTGLNATNIAHLHVAGALPSVIYCEFLDVGVYKSTNSGADWTSLPEFLSCGNICAIVTRNDDPNCVFALEGSG